MELASFILVAKAPQEHCQRQQEERNENGTGELSPKSQCCKRKTKNGVIAGEERGSRRIFFSFSQWRNREWLHAVGRDPVKMEHEGGKGREAGQRSSVGKRMGPLHRWRLISGDHGWSMWRDPREVQWAGPGAGVRVRVWWDLVGLF
jgi:hypothetical protein